jgi:hypothetical protein
LATSIYHYPAPGAIDRVLNVVSGLQDGETLTHEGLVARTGLPGHLVFEVISAIDGVRVLIGGDRPSATD